MNLFNDVDDVKEEFLRRASTINNFICPCIFSLLLCTGINPVTLACRNLLTRRKLRHNADVIFITENTHHRGKDHCMADLLFDWFGFNQTSKAYQNSTKAKQLNPNKINRRSAVQWVIPPSIVSVLCFSPFATCSWKYVKSKTAERFLS